MQRKHIHVPTGTEVPAAPAATRAGQQLQVPSVFVGGTPGRVPPIYTGDWREERFDIEHKIVTLVRP